MSQITPAKIYPVVVPAFGMVELAVVGDFFKILSAAGTITVRGDTFGTVGELLPGQGLEDRNFTRLQFTDTSGADNALRVLVAGQSFIDDRITGEVSVIDGELVRSRAGAAFNAYGAVPGVAGQLSYLEIWNPPDSGKRVIVSDVLFSTQAAGSPYVLRITTAQVSASVVGAPSKLAGGARSSAYFFSGNVVAGALAGVTMELALCATNYPLKRTYKQPYVLPPGAGIVVNNNSAAADMYAALQFTEEAI